MALIENKAIGLIVGSAVELIVAGAAIEAVGAIAGEEGVIAFAAFNGVSGSEANDDVGLIGANEISIRFRELRFC